MPAVRIVAIPLLFLAAACAGIAQPPAGALPQSNPVTVDPSLTGRKDDGAVAARPIWSGEKSEGKAASAPPPAEPRQPALNGNEANAKAKETLAAAPAPVSPGPDAAKTAPPPKAAAKVSASAAGQTRKDEAPHPAAKPPESLLDVAALKARLRDTDAIGVFTKLALKNQVDDLLQQFRAHYLSGQKTSVASLRQPYDMLVLKVLALLQDGDPPLARTISGSREAIWGILADPEKFKSAS